MPACTCRTSAAPARAARPAAVYATLKGYAQPATIRLATLEGRQHLVAPVVVMVADSVVQGLHSKGPEFVPRSVLAVAPFGLDGRPVVYSHPETETGSANDPSTVNAMRYGQVFNSGLNSAGNLTAEVWIDLDRADLLGAETQQVVADVRAGRAVEVSLGAWIAMVEESGTSPSGTPYEWVWEMILSFDHLAVGLGGEGACSVEMGCGTGVYAARRATLAALCPKPAAAPVLPADLDVKLSPSLIVRASYSSIVRERFTVQELTFLSDYAPHLLEPLAEMGATDATNRTHYAAYVAAGRPMEQPEPFEGRAYAVETARAFLDRNMNSTAVAGLRKRSAALDAYAGSGS